MFYRVYNPNNKEWLPQCTGCDPTKEETKAKIFRSVKEATKAFYYWRTRLKYRNNTLLKDEWLIQEFEINLLKGHVIL